MGSGDLSERVFAGDPQALARALRMVEERRPGCGQVLAEVASRIGRASRVGVTGPPGVGKSTLVAALLREARRRGRRVAVLAVDPSSPVSGGALMADRLRMGDTAADSDVFIRSMASRGRVGGIAGAAGDALDLLDAAGFDLILLETAGAGQTDLEVAAEADLTLVVLAPGTGDGIQAMKSGMMEIADLFAINKADDPEAERVRAAVIHALKLKESREDPSGRIHLVSALTGEGVAELMDGLDASAERLRAAGDAQARRRERVAHRLRALAHDRLNEDLGRMEDFIDDLAQRTVDGEVAAAEAVARIFERLGSGGSSS